MVKISALEFACVDGHWVYKEVQTLESLKAYGPGLIRGMQIRDVGIGGGTAGRVTTIRTAGKGIYAFETECGSLTADRLELCAEQIRAALKQEHYEVRGELHFNLIVCEQADLQFWVTVEDSFTEA